MLLSGLLAVACQGLPAQPAALCGMAHISGLKLQQASCADLRCCSQASQDPEYPALLTKQQELRESSVITRA